jgi:hypothetical protein
LGESMNVEKRGNLRALSWLFALALARTSGINENPIRVMRLKYWLFCRVLCCRDGLSPGFDVNQGVGLGKDSE